MKRLAGAVVSVVVVLELGVVASCTLSGEEPEVRGKTVAAEAKPRRYVPTQEVIVTRGSEALPPRCSPRDVAGLITNFFDAVNRGDREAVSTFIALDNFGWYSMTEGNPEEGGRHFFTDDRGRLLAYFEKRYRHGERLQLLLVDVGIDSSASVGIHFVIRRDADDLKPGWGGRQRIAEGKGNIDCARQRIRVWSAGMDPASGSEFPPYVAWSCPAPEGGRPTRGPVIACARA